VKNKWDDLECNKEYGTATRRRGGKRRSGKRRSCVVNLRWGIELQRFKNEEGRWEEGDKERFARMILGEGGRWVWREGAASCPTAKRCPGGASGTAYNPDLYRPDLVQKQ
jgi:hypothetical protein